VDLEGSEDYFVGVGWMGLNFVEFLGVGKGFWGRMKFWIGCSHLGCRFQKGLIALQGVVATSGIVRCGRNLRLVFSVRRDAETLIWFLGVGSVEGD
jgi:hypothetical protein